MNPTLETGKLEPGGSMANTNDGINRKDQDLLSSGARGAGFEIHVRGQLDESWSDWLGGLQVKLLENGEMILCGHVGDQAALMGVLNKLYGLNLALLSVNEIKNNKD